MPDFRIVQQEEDAIPFTNGYQVIIKRELTAGDDQDLKDYMLRLKHGGNGAGPEFEMRMGDRKLVELAVIRIIDPQGVLIPVTPELIANLDRQTFATILAEVHRRNPPLAGK